MSGHRWCFWARWSAVALEVFSTAPVGLKQYSVCIRLPIHTSYMSKQWETSSLDDGGKWRLFSHVTDIIISDEVVPSNVKNLPEAPLPQCINSQHVSFINYPALGPTHKALSVVYMHYTDEVWCELWWMISKDDDREFAWQFESWRLYSNKIIQFLTGVATKWGWLL